MLLSYGRHVLEVSYPSTIHCLEEDKVWSTISSFVVWVLWNARRKCVFRKVKQNVVGLVKDIWKTMHEGFCYLTCCFEMGVRVIF